jgi:S1-C subfamily serine protease
VRGSGEAYTLTMPGLKLTKVTGDLAEYFGDGSERGLLVVDAEGPWEGLRPGDIMLSVNGRLVRTGDDATVTYDPGRTNTIVVLRKGRRTTIEIPRSR